MTTKAIDEKENARIGAEMRAEFDRIGDALDSVDDVEPCHMMLICLIRAARAAIWLGMTPGDFARDALEFYESEKKRKRSRKKREPKIG